MSTDQTVWKFAIPIGDEFSLTMPGGAKILTVQTQFDQPFIWALLDPSAPIEMRHFRLAGTGHPVSAGDRLKHVGTFQLRGGELVFHLFEKLPP